MDPFTSFVIGGASSLAANLVTKMLEFSGTRIKKQFHAPNVRKSLQNALASALKNAVNDLETDDQLRGAILKVFEEWILKPSVAGQFCKFLTPSWDTLLDIDFLAEEFEEHGLLLQQLGRDNFDQMIRNIAGAFYNAVIENPLLQEPLKVDQLRQMILGMGALIEVQTRSFGELEQIRRFSEEFIKTGQRGNELIQAILSELETGRLNRHALYQTAMVALDHTGLLNGETLALDHQRTADLQRIRVLLDQIHEKLNAPETGHTEQELEAMAEIYRQSIIDWFEILTFKGISPSGKAIVLPLEKVYVELKTVADVPEAADTYSLDSRHLITMEAGPHRECCKVPVVSW